ncbi:hypothetical protein QJS10_CPB20g00657 [Acorus calamus]|uniref:ER membrane protein complex subunit 1 n=1 Tax=Acorus calamus TaxID=4465 RepID=A0AAV9C8K3_ACOCL|nr:hypothetical protein QJS10_CPB20g00657 [Acorus calamus]
MAEGSENWVVYHYFNLRAHRYEMSVIEIYDQSRVVNKNVWKLVLGKHNLTSPLKQCCEPVTSTTKGITTKQLLIGTIGSQVLALDKRYLDPRRSLSPSQAEKEEGIIPLTDSLPIIPQDLEEHWMMSQLSASKPSLLLEKVIWHRKALRGA